MPSKAKNLSKLRLPILLITSAIASFSCSTGPSSRQILNAMMAEMMLDDKPQTLTSPQNSEMPRPAKSSAVGQVISFPKPLRLTLTLLDRDNERGPGIDIKIDAALPEGVKIPVDFTNTSGHLLIKTSAKKLQGRYGNLTANLKYKHVEQRNFRTTFHSYGKVRKTYKGEPVEFVDPNPLVLYSVPFDYPYGPNGTPHVLVWDKLQPRPAKTKTTVGAASTYESYEAMLIPYAETPLRKLLERTATRDPVHAVATRLLENLRKPPLNTPQ